MSDARNSGPTVTMFGDRDALGEALSEELGRRGFSTHEVTTPAGWFGSVTNAVVRLDSPIGAQALAALLSRGEMAAAHLVAVCETPADAAVSERVDDLCRRCSAQHDVSLLWHPSFDLQMGSTDDVGMSPDALAVVIADEIGRPEAGASGPAFVSRTLEPQRSCG